MRIRSPPSSKQLQDYTSSRQRHKKRMSLTHAVAKCCLVNNVETSSHSTQLGRWVEFPKVVLWGLLTLFFITNLYNLIGSVNEWFEVLHRNTKLYHERNCTVCSLRLFNNYVVSLLFKAMTPRALWYKKEYPQSRSIFVLCSRNGSK